MYKLSHISTVPLVDSGCGIKGAHKNWSMVIHERQHPLLGLL